MHQVAILTLNLCWRNDRALWHYVPANVKIWGWLKLSYFRADCPRCDTKGSSFAVRGQNHRGMEYGWKSWLEVYCVCGHCHKSVIFVVSQKHSGPDFSLDNSLTGHKGYINDVVDYTGYINLKDLAQQQPPEHLPDGIALAFKEAATCKSVQCWNASGAMYRACIDLATKPLMPPEGEEPNKSIRRSLGLRLKWLFENGKLPMALEGLSHAIQQDGNDGVHDVNLKEVEVEDIADFTFEMLETLFTIPGRLKLAQERRDQRRASPKK